jgi:hypothetical protein
VKLTEHEMLVTLANMALRMDDLTGEDVLDAFKQLGYESVVKEARELPNTERKLSPEDKKYKDFLDKNLHRTSFNLDEQAGRIHTRIYGTKQEQLADVIESTMKGRDGIK